MPAVDVLAGGFPCQDISVAGKRVGIDGERSGLWREYYRIIGELRPRFVVVENVAALLNRGMGRVLGDLAAAGYDAEWCCISAADVGAPHLRERIWIVAYPVCDGRNGGRCPQGNIFPAQRQTESAEQFWDRWFNRFGAVGEVISDSMRELAEGNGIGWSSGLGWWEREPEEAVQNVRQGGWEETWLTESKPVLGRLAHGVSNRVERLTALGNSIVPQIAEWIGRRIVACAESEAVGSE